LNREVVYDYIIEHAVAYGIAQVSVDVIEERNILNASWLTSSLNRPVSRGKNRQGVSRQQHINLKLNPAAIVADLFNITSV